LRDTFFVDEQAEINTMGTETNSLRHMRTPWRLRASTRLIRLRHNLAESRQSERPIHARVRLAAGTNGWYKDVEGVAVQAGLLSGQVLHYPGAKDSFLLGGAGFAILNCDGWDGESGAGFVIGAGYDIPINRSGSLALTPFVNWILTTIEANPHFIQFGLGLTFN